VLAKDPLDIRRVQPLQNITAVRLTEGTISA
jgi:hypothetical protein